MRNLALCVVATLAVSGCASTYSAPITLHAPYVNATPPGPNIYSMAPRGSLQSELFVCSNWGANLGEIGSRGEALRYTPYIHTRAGPLLRNPTEGACLSSGFGWRGRADGGGRVHGGLDLANPDGGFVYAAAEGRITYADWRGGYGIVLELDHGRGVRTFYAHLAEIDPNLRRGDVVPAGAPVARMGQTGNATGVHLHYEVSIDGLAVDPLVFGAEPPPVL